MRTSFTARALFALSALFIVYATTIPWDFGQPFSLDRVAWIPLWDPERGRPPSIPDLVQNVVLFLPFGFFGALGLSWIRRRRTITGALFVGALGFVLSLFVEALQTMSLERTPSASDLTTNTFGALFGGALALFWARHLEARVTGRVIDVARERPGLLVFIAYLVVVSAGALAPFIPSLDVSDLRANVHQLLADPWGKKPLGALVPDLVLFAALSFLAARELAPFLAAHTGRARHGGAVSRLAAALFGVAFVTLLALALEVAQLFIIDHGVGLEDAAVATIGALVGAAAVTLVDRRVDLFPARRLGELTELAPGLVLAFALLAPTLRALAPFHFIPLSEKLATFSLWQLVPFWALFQNVTLSTFRNVFEAALTYAPLGWALYVLRRSTWQSALACFVVADTLELAQLFVADRTVDATEGIFAAAGALAAIWAYTHLEERLELGEAPRRAS